MPCAPAITAAAPRTGTNAADPGHEVVVSCVHNPTPIKASPAHAKAVLGWQTRPVEQSIVDTARCLLDLTPYVQVAPHAMNEHASAHR